MADTFLEVKRSRCLAKVLATISAACRAGIKVEVSVEVTVVMDCGLSRTKPNAAASTKAMMDRAMIALPIATLSGAKQVGGHIGKPEFIPMAELGVLPPFLFAQEDQALRFA